MPTAAPRRHLLPPAAALVVAVTVLLLPYPGSLSVQVTRALAVPMAGTSGIALLSEVPMWLLAAATAAAVGRAWWARLPHRAAALAGAAGVGLAYAASTTVKTLTAQERPCAVWPLDAPCASTGWSFPSNHSTLAFGAVVVLALATRSLLVATLGLALALVVGAGRVMEGAHYLHDVAAGAALGIVLVSGTVLAATRLHAGSGSDRAGAALRVAGRHPDTGP